MGIKRVKQHNVINFQYFNCIINQGPNDLFVAVLRHIDIFGHLEPNRKKSKTL